MKFLPLFTVRAAHTYYTDGKCMDFSIQPNRPTAGLISKHRCVVKPCADGIRMLTAVDENKKPLIALPAGAMFIFHMRLHNPDFVRFTNLSDFNVLPAPVYTNADLGSGDARLLRLNSRTAWQTERLVVVNPAPEEDMVLRGRPLDKLELDEIEYEGSAKVSPQKYNAADKIYTVNSQSAPKGETFKIKYPVRPQLERSVWAEVEIRNNASLPPIDKGPVEFSL